MPSLIRNFEDRFCHDDAQKTLDQSSFSDTQNVAVIPQEYITKWPDCREISYAILCAYLSRVVRKPDFCISENKGADQLRGNREADQRLCFRYTDSAIPLLPNSEISSL